METRHQSTSAGPTVAAALETALLAEESIHDCIVIERTTEIGEITLVAYILSTGPVLMERWQEQVQRARLEGTPPVLFVPVTRLPLTPEGTVDKTALERLPVLDDALASRCAERLRAAPTVADAVGLVEEHIAKPQPLHLGDLLPGWRAAQPARPAERRDHTIEVDSAVRDGGRVALSQGSPLAVPADAPQTFTEAIQRAATAFSTHGTTYVETRGPESFLSYAEQASRARQLLGGLQSSGLLPGDKVLLQVDRLEDYCTALWACILGGYVPVTIAVAASFDTPNAVVTKLHHAWAFLDQPVILASGHLVEPLAGLARQFLMPDLRILSFSALAAHEPSKALHTATPDDVLLLQLSSGSTGVAKCVPQTHRAVVAHVHAVQQFNGYSDRDVVLNWLPMDHVGALLMFYLRALYLGCRQVMVQTDVVLADPLRWLDLLANHKATNTWSPNFGYKLVADRLAAPPNRSWDLSAMRLFLNGGEQVTEPVVRAFLERVAPFGVRQQAMQPAFGMAETCTGVTYENRFTLENGILYLGLSAAGSQVRQVSATTPGARVLIPLGRPIPGVELCIVDQQDHLLAEGTIGRLKIRGPVVTSGYLRNAEADAEAFTADRWFSTGDLGFLLDGALTITGREKEMIVVRGANIFCHDIEDAVAAIEGVEATFVGSCAIEDLETGTEGFAVFFVPTDEERADLAALVKTIGQTLGGRLGITPSVVVPMARAAFPKTTSGKIQRLQLQRWLREGRFQDTLTALDIAQGNANTLPAWFYQPVWRRKELRSRRVQAGTEHYLLFGDQADLHVSLLGRLSQEGATVVIVGAGPDFVQVDRSHFRLDPADATHYDRLLVSLREQGAMPNRILHLWTYGHPGSDSPAMEEVQQAQTRGAVSVLHVLRALAQQPSSGKVTLLVVSSHLQSVLPGDRIAPERSPLLGVVKTASQELPWLDCRHLDVPADGDRSAEAVLRELRSGDHDGEVAYRDGRRLVSRLERVNWSAEPKQSPPFKRGGMYVLTGGLGGVAQEVARLLLQRFDARLLLVGRTALPDPEHWEARFREGGPIAERIRAFQTLTALGGDVRYERADVADLDRLGDLIGAAETRWQCRLDGVIHLAGVFHDRLLVEETAESFMAALRPKVLGAWALHRLTEERPDCLFVTFSSVNGHFGGYGAGAYAAANAFLDHIVYYRRNQRQLLGNCFAWTMWSDLGLAREFPLEQIELARGRGFMPLTAQQGVTALLVGLTRDLPHMLIGLDESRPRLAPEIEAPVAGRHRLHAYVAPTAGVALADLPGVELNDQYGTRADCTFTCLPALPQAAQGTIDLAQLSSQTVASAPGDAPHTELERRLVAIWCEVLGLAHVGMHDSFFALGGTSLTLAQLSSRLRDTVASDLDARALFEAPTIAELSERITQRNQYVVSQPRSLEAISLASRDRPLPLSSAQMRLWFLDQLLPAKHAYNEAWATRFSGELNQDALQRGLTELVARHEVLRTAFVALSGEPRQVIAAPPLVPVPLIDLSALDEGVREEGVHRLVSQEARRSFDLTQAPLFRATLYRLTPSDHVLLLVIHHIVFDGWSLGVLRRELAALYAAFRKGEPSPLPPLPFQYADFAVWHRNWLAGEHRQVQLAYWQERLADLSALPFPLDCRRPSVPSYRGASVPVRITPQLAVALRALAAEERVTLFMTLLAAFQSLLVRYTGQDDITVCTPVAGRSRTDLEPLIGFFVNTVVLRTDLSGAPSFREALARVRDVATGAFEHQDLPFDQLVEHLHPARDQAYNPLVQVAFALQNAPMGTMQLEGLTSAPFEADTETAKFDLFLELEDGPAGIVGRFQFSTDLFVHETVERLRAHFLTLLAGAVAEPDRSLTALPLLTAMERRQVTDGWNQTTTAYPREATLAALFAEQVALRPEAIAVESGSQQLTYAALNRRASQMAWALCERGVGPGVLVGVLIERSPEAVTALLGIVQAGGAYVPLDPSYPAQRLEYLLADTGVAVVVAQPGLLDRLPPHEGVSVLLVGDVMRDAVPSAPPPGARADDLAYVTYTSGSTGQPKGVAVPQRAVVRLVCGTNYAQFGPEETWLWHSPLAFDASTLEVWGALLQGGRLVVAPPGLLAGQELLALVEQTGVTRLWLTAALLALLAEGSLAPLRGLRQLLAGGEVLSPSAVACAQRALPDTVVTNGYGPTENTTFTCCYTAPVGVSAEESIPIGRPIANTRVYVLDRWMEPAPIGVPGELYAGGDGLARGYLGQAALTAERFVPDPFGATAGGRLYRTGDLVRYRADGVLEFLGRVDGQVKLRGFRIELGEIEVVLAQHPAVREAMVLLREDRPGHRRLVAYVRARGALPVAPDELRSFLARRLPDYMVPAALVVLETMPLNANGKVDRRALPAPTEESRDEEGVAAPRSMLEELLIGIWLDVLGVQRVGIHANFFDVGGHSLLLMQVHARLCQALGRDLSVTELFRYPTIADLAQHLAGDGQPAAAPRRIVTPVSTSDAADGIAIIGMSGRFPGAPDLDTFWRNLAHGVEAIRHFSDDELLAAGVDAHLMQRPDYVKSRGVLDDVESFDAGFFGYSPREADITDPQHRLFLEEAWAAFEHAGYAPSQMTVPVGVFAGVSTSTYLPLITAAEPNALADSYQLGLGNDKDHLTTRVAYKLDLRGPGVTVQTACSTSLVAVATACQSLLNRHCDVALAGGASIGVPQVAGYVYQAEGILSPDGHCRAYDAAAQGTVPGSGAGAVVLKRLADAQTDGDTIHAVIKGFAVNNDGAGKVGFTAPSVQGQVAVIRAAQAMAGIAPESIACIEGHGTGTLLGDPIEVAALREVFQAGRGQATCALGSVKTNIGHLDAAAGIAGLLKVILALAHSEIPPSLHFQEANPRLELERSPFFVPVSPMPWPTTGLPRRAGVSSFGVGGTNVHVVLEAPPELPPAAPARPVQAMLLSARTAGALDRATSRLADHIEREPDLSLADAAFTLQVGRCHFAYRRAVICGERSEAIKQLRAPEPAVIAERTGRPVVFLFPGQGAQHLGMAQAIYRMEPAFRAAFDRCADRLNSLLGQDLRSVIFPAEHSARAAAALTETALAQPALFAVEYALARLWMDRGLEPVAMLGHSIGEYVAACLADVFTLDEALALVAARGRLMQRMAPGAMLAVALSAEQLHSWLSADLALAAVNTPTSCVVSGPVANVERLACDLTTAGITATRLHTSRAFHSAMVDPVLADFAAEVARLRPQAPRRPFLSNVTGTWVTAEQVADPAYWTGHARQTVRFADGLAELLHDRNRVLLEVGPGQTLQRLVRSMPTGAGTTVVATLPHPRNPEADDVTLARAGAALWLAGVELDWAATHRPAQRRHIPLPVYPFERDRHWVERTAPSSRPEAGAIVSSKRLEMRDWFSTPLWRQTLPRRPFPAANGAEDAVPGSLWLLLGDHGGVAEALRVRLEEAGHGVVTVAAGQTFERQSERAYTLSPSTPEHYAALFDDLGRQGLLPGRVVHLWSIDARTAAQSDDPAVEETLERGFYSLLLLIQALAARQTEHVRLDVVTNNMLAVTGDESLQPMQATVLGACKVIPQEFPRWRCRCIDVAIASPGAGHRRQTEQLLAELTSDAADSLVAYRGMHRWAPNMERVAPVVNGTKPWRSGGVYLITGGFGGVGRTLAEHLARDASAKLVLLGRVPLPDRPQWDDWLAEHDLSDEVGSRIRQVLALEAAGAEVMVATADVANRMEMVALVRRIGARFGTLHGVIHAAGIAGGGILQLMTSEKAAEVLTPKVHGTLALMEAVRDIPLDFVLLCSSLISLIGGAGRADYCAANAFLDAYAHQAVRDGRSVVSVNWDTWRDVGMAVEANLPADLAAKRAMRLQEGIQPQEGIDVVHRALAAGLAQVAVSTTELTIIPAASEEPEAGLQPPALRSSVQRHDRPAVRSAFVPAQSPTEQAVAEAWQDLLGLSKVGINDDFYELGGHSLLAIQLLARLRDLFQVEISLDQFFEGQTVARLAETIDQRMVSSSQEAQQLADALNLVERLSLEELTALLEQTNVVGGGVN